MTDIYPELSDMKKCVKKKVVLDGELVVLTDGKPNFYALQKRGVVKARTYRYGSFHARNGKRRNAPACMERVTG